MELDKGCNNLKNVSQVCGSISNVEQIESKVDNMVKVVVTKLYKGKNTDSIETVVDNDSYEIYANLVQTQYNSKLEFPNVGSTKLLYVDLSDNSVWRFDKEKLQYICVGRDYTQIQSKSFSTISDMVLELNSYSSTELKVATNLYIQSLDVPDFWVYSVEETNVQYVYTSDNDLISEINNNGSLQIGYYKISMLETEKVDLADYATIEFVNGLVATINSSIEEINTTIENINSNKAEKSELPTMIIL